MHQRLWGYKVEEKLYVGVHEQKRLNTSALRISNTSRYFVSAIASSLFLFVQVTRMSK